MPAKKQATTATSQLAEMADVIAIAASEDDEIKKAAQHLLATGLKGSQRYMEYVFGPMGSTAEKMAILKWMGPAVLRAMQTEQASEQEREIRETQARILEMARSRAKKRVAGGSADSAK